MKINIIKKAFTLIELLVAIAVISIVILWATNINYNRLNTEQKLSIFINQIKSDYERMRNSSLEWKWIWLNLEIPQKIKIDYSNVSSWSIIISYTTWSTWVVQDDKLFQTGYSIWDIECLNIDWSIDDTINSGTWIIEIKWINISLTWSCTPPSKILKIPLEYKWNTWTLEINTISWIAEIK